MAAFGSKRCVKSPSLAGVFICAAVCSLLWVAACSGETAGAEACAEEGLVLDFGFYAYYAPISYGADSDPDSDGFDTHLGYEADLLTALEAMDGAGLSASRARPVARLGRHLASACGTPEYDIVGGGITILDTSNPERGR